MFIHYSKIQSAPAITHRKGFVLVITLALIVLSTMILAGLARKSMNIAREVKHREEQVQKRWGILSCRDVLLNNSKELLENQASLIPFEERTWPVPSQITAEFLLGKLRFHIQISDEDSKINLNKIYRSSATNPESRNINKVRDMITQLEQSTGTSSLETRIQFPTGIDKKTIHSPFQSWGQIFSNSQSNEDNITAQLVMKKTKNLSCWGKGQLNIRRASDLLIRAMGQVKIGTQSLKIQTLETLITLRKQTEITGFDQILNQLQPKGQERLLIRQLFTDQSSCQSLWILVNNENNRQWGSLMVNQPGQIDGQKTVSFYW